MNQHSKRFFQVVQPSKKSSKNQPSYNFSQGGGSHLTTKATKQLSMGPPGEAPQSSYAEQLPAKSGFQTTSTHQ